MRIRTITLVSVAMLCAPVALAAGGGGAEALTQGGWASLLVERMQLTKTLPANASHEAIALLGARPTAIEKSGATAKLVVADGGARTWKYEVSTPATATWLLVTRSGSPAFVSVDRAPSEMTGVAPNGAGSDVARRPLLAGTHTVTVHVANGAQAPDLALVGGCSTVAPVGGWQASAPLTWGVLSRTLVQALKQNGRLPAAEALPIAQVGQPQVTLQVEHEGTYTVLLAGHAFDRATYRVDGCEETHPAAIATADGWREGGTIVLLPGAHTLSFFGMGNVPDGRVRFVRRSASDEDYLAVLSSMGVKLPKLTAEAAPRLHAEADPPRRDVGGIRHAHGDVFAGIANRIVTRDEANAVLDTPAIARLLARTPRIPNRRTDVVEPPKPGEFDTFETPISPTVPGSPDSQ